MAKNRKVKLVVKDYRDMYKEDMRSGNGYDITTPEGLAANGDREDGGIYSSKYGSLWGDENAFAERYRCECGYLKSRIYEGSECPECHTPVKFVDNNLQMTGWLHLENENYLIHPTLCRMIETLIGNRKVFFNIIDADYNLNLEGQYELVKADTGKPHNDKYYGIGMTEFYYRFDEIIDYYYNYHRKKRPIVEEYYHFIMENREKVFTKFVPVYSLLLRPISITEENFRFGQINGKYAKLTSKIFGINKNNLSTDKKRIRLYRLLSEAQKIFMDIHDDIISSLSKKEGHIRGNILGSRFNFSSRNVIVPLSNCKINEIKLPYLGFLELFKPELINLMIKSEGITISEATDKWQKATISFSNKMYQFMKYLINNTKGGLRVLINRNPTISYGSVLCMKVDVKEAYDDYTMSIPINVLGVLAGDFDGDVLNIISLKGRELTYSYNAAYNPRSNMLINRNDGKFNSDFNLIKDQLISLHQFNQIGKTSVRQVRVKRTKEKAVYDAIYLD